jgi:hypothetical protein
LRDHEYRKRPYPFECLTDGQPRTDVDVERAEYVMFRDPTHPELTEIAARLRAEFDPDVVEEREITEVETEQGRRRRSTLDQVWTESMNRGDLVTAKTTFGPLVGSVEYVGIDYASVNGDDMSWDLRLDRASVQVRRSTNGGHSVSGGSRTFKARLAEYEATGEDVMLLAPSLDLEVCGRLAVIATDHLVVTTVHGEMTIPLAALDGVRRHL